MRHQKTQPWAPLTETPDQWPQTAPTSCVQKGTLDGTVETFAAAAADAVDGVGVAGVGEKDSPQAILLHSQKATPCCHQQETQRPVRAAAVETVVVAAAAVDAQRDWQNLC